MQSEFRKFLLSFKYAFNGIRVALNQRNLKVQIAVASVIMLVGMWLKVGSVEWAVLVLTIGLVISLELINTSIEAFIDLASPQYHPLAKRSKDMAAGAVLVAAIVAAIVGLLILGPPLLRALYSIKTLQ